MVFNEASSWWSSEKKSYQIQKKSKIKLKNELPKFARARKDMKILMIQKKIISNMIRPKVLRRLVLTKILIKTKN